MRTKTYLTGAGDWLMGHAGAALANLSLPHEEEQFEASNIGMNKHSVTEQSAWWQWNISPPTTYLVNRRITDQPGCLV